jgi:arylsulfatase A-like enzyme
MDWVATFLDAAGVAPHPDYPLDGVSLLKEHAPRELFWRMKFRSQKAMRSANWKWLSIEGSEFLFDLAKDWRKCAAATRRGKRPCRPLRTMREFRSSTARPTFPSRPDG